MLRFVVLGTVCCGLVGIAGADLRVAIGNDTFSEARPPYDDDGFTNDIDVRFWRAHGDYLLGGRLFDRWITEVPRIAGRRRDLLELVATIERSWGEPRVRAVTVATRGGPVFTGNLGGRWGQNAFHGLCHCGDTLDEGLQARYERGRAAGALLGVRVEGSAGAPVAHAYGVVDGQLSVGTGVSWIEGALGGRLVVRIGRTELAAHAELAGLRSWVADDDLAIPGGYRPGWHAVPRVGVHVAWGRVRIEYEYRVNESGSGEPIGVLAVTVRQAGRRL